MHAQRVAREPREAAEAKLGHARCRVHEPDREEHDELAEARRLIGDTARVKLIEGAAEKLPFEDASLDLVVSSFLLHELPAEIRARALAEMARVLRPDGLAVVVDSIQRGDQPAWDGLLDLFPHYFHEPYYADYVAGRLRDWATSAGLAVVATERAFLSTVTALSRA